MNRLSKEQVKIKALEATIGILKDEINEFDCAFDLRWKADMRAIKLWQEKTGKKLIWPDHTDLCTWLLEQLDKSNNAR